jgi:hypothetical protein
VEPIDFDTPCDVVALTAFNVQSQSRSSPLIQSARSQ